MRPGALDASLELGRAGVNTPSRGGYVVFQRVAENDWRVIGEADRRPGLPARKSRGQAVRDVLGREPEPGDAFSVLQRSEWRNALDH